MHRKTLAGIIFHFPSSSSVVDDYLCPTFIKISRFNENLTVFRVNFNLPCFSWNQLAEPALFDQILETLGVCGFQKDVYFLTRQVNTLDLLFSKVSYPNKCICFDPISSSDHHTIPSHINCTPNIKITTYSSFPDFYGANWKSIASCIRSHDWSNSLRHGWLLQSPLSAQSSIVSSHKPSGWYLPLRQLS